MKWIQFTIYRQEKARARFVKCNGIANSKFIQRVRSTHQKRVLQYLMLYFCRVHSTLYQINAHRFNWIWKKNNFFVSLELQPHIMGSVNEFGFEIVLRAFFSLISLFVLFFSLLNSQSFSFASILILLIFFWKAFAAVVGAVVYVPQWIFVVFIV